MTDVTTPVADLPLNKEQTEAADGFFEFLLSDEREMNIRGPGGVGKTHLMGHMIDKIMPRYFQSCKLIGMEPEYDSVQMTATTNKAAEVLSLAAMKPTQTIHSFMNLTVFDDFSTGKSKIQKSRSWMVHEKKIIFIDEGSMIDTPLDRMIDEGTLGCKIVYVGDHCQMAPVMEPISPIYARPMRTYNLTQPMRSNIPEIHALNQQLRDTVESGVFNPIQIVPGIIDWLSPDEMEAEVVQHFATQDESARMLAYTNKMVLGLNQFVRDIRNLPPEFTAGEILINNSAIRLRGYMLSVEEEVTIDRVSPIMESIWIDHHDGQDIMLDVWSADISCKLGGEFKGVHIPADREHFDRLKKWYTSRKDWSKKYQLQNNYPDFRQRDASTVYKAQGSSLDTVYIDAGNISTCHNPSQVARMMYVANSRARKRIAYYGQLAAKYGGFIF